VDPKLVALATLISEYYFKDISRVLELFEVSATKRKRPEPTVPSPYQLLPLSKAQEHILHAIQTTEVAAISEHLIWGVTGSGKTRIYEHLIAQIIESEAQALLLLPEIALSGQIMRVIGQRFGSRAVLFHSALSLGDRAQAYERFESGDASIAIGTRSAIFLPAKNLRLIVIDEEHDASYKDQRNVRFDARVIARLRQKIEPEIQLVLGSATPSLETLARAKTGQAKLHRLNARATGQSLPTVHLPEYKQQHGVIGPFLANKMREHLSQGNQVLLLMNRRGHSTHVHCSECDSFAECPRCSVALTYHKDNYLKCHHCGHNEAYQEICPKDNNRRKLSGRGIQRVEEVLETQFASHPYARLDRDTAGKKGFFNEVLEGLAQKKIDILIGTQMIAKGFDIPGVTLVGVLAIDNQLTAADFRAGESAWQLLAQVVGRSGRHQPGEVVIQTMSPHHAAIVAARDHDPDEFYRSEAEYRRLTHYPPFGVLARIVLQSENENLLMALADRAARELTPMNAVDLFQEKHEAGVTVLGPAYPNLRKKESIFRVHFLLKALNEAELRSYLRRVMPLVERVVRAEKSVTFYLDVDPRETN